MVADAVTLPVNLPAVADVVEEDSSLLRVKFVQDAVVSDSQTKLGAALQTLMREVGKIGSHPIHLVFDGLSDRFREAVK